MIQLRLPGKFINEIKIFFSFRLFSSASAAPAFFSFHFLRFIGAAFYRFSSAMEYIANYVCVWLQFLTQIKLEKSQYYARAN